jgi:hypothetical protein
MFNLFYYSEQFSTSSAALYDMCWSIGDHKFYIFNDGTVAYTPDSIMDSEAKLA